MVLHCLIKKLARVKNYNVLLYSRTSKESITKNSPEIVTCLGPYTGEIMGQSCGREDSQDNLIVFIQ